jgi:general secretion pathway protein H
LRVVASDRRVPCRLGRGFTLVEMMVVLLVIGLMTGIAVLSMNLTRGNAARQAADRLRDLVGIVHDQSDMQGRSFAIGFWKHGWRFYELDDKGRWRIPRQDPLLRARRYDADVDFALRLQGLDVKLADTDKTHPQVYLLAGGDAQPFTLDIVQDGSRRERVQGDNLGDVTVHAVGGK